MADQYEAFAERRRNDAEVIGEARYLDDLRSSTSTIEVQRKMSPLLERILWAEANAEVDGSEGLNPPAIFPPIF